MDDAIQAQLTTLGNEVGTAAIPDASRQKAAWCFRQLPALYAQFRQTSESRYGEEISRLVQGVLLELAALKGTCPEALPLAARVTERFRLLHEEFGIPKLNLKPLGASPTRSRKAS
jgi:hypothetical protein